MPLPTERPSLGRRVFKWMLENKTLVAGAITLCGLAFYRINPLHDLAELRDRRNMVALHINAGDQMLDVGQYDEARAEFENALKLDSTSSAAHRGIIEAGIFSTMKEATYDPEVTQRRLEFLEQDNPNDAHMRVFQGNLLQGSGDYKQALEKYKQALAINPRLAEAYAGIGLVYDVQADIDQAIPNYQQAVAISPYSQRYLNNLAYDIYQKGNYDKAISLYLSALTLDGRFLLSYYILGSAYRLKGDLNGAQQIEERLLTLLSDSKIASLERNQGVWLFHLQGSQLVYLDNLKRKESYARYSLALTMFVAGKQDQATEQVRFAEALKVDDSASIVELVRFDIGKIASVQSAWQKRLKDFQDALLR